MSKVFGDPEKAKIRQLISEGVTVLQEVQVLTEGLNDTIKAVAEELEVKPAQLNKVIKIAHKANLNDVRADFEEVENLLDQLGRGI